MRSESEETLKKLLRVINIYLTEKGYPPSVREMCKEMDVSSTSTIQYYLNQLEEQGKIKKGGKKNRAIELVKDYSLSSKEAQTINIPLIGEVAAGRPILAVENYECEYEMPKYLFRGDNLFMLRVRGESMIEAGIFDDDFVVVKKQNYADNGDIVVAMINGSATVKRFYREDGHIRLQPENSTMEPIYCFEVEILGKVTGVIRRY